MTTSDSTLILLDTNVLVYAADESSEFHEQSKAVRDAGAKGDIAMCLCPQVLCELYAVTTDPRRVTNPLSREQAVAEVENYYRAKRFTKIYPNPEMMRVIFELLHKYSVTRQEIFDLQLVATMLSNDVRKIYTFNHSHFRTFESEIEILIP